MWNTSIFKVWPRWAKIVSLLLLALLLGVVVYVVYKVITIEYYKSVLRERGVSEEFIAKLETIPTSPEDADEKAIQYFTDYLIGRGVEADFIEQTAIQLIDIRIADEVEEIYRDEQAFQQEHSILRDAIIELEQAVQREQVIRIASLKNDLNAELNIQIAELEASLEKRIDEELAKIESKMRVCIVASFVPVFGVLGILGDALSGTDHCTGEKLQGWERLLNLAPIADFSKLDNVLDFFKGLGKAGNIIDAIKSAKHTEDLTKLLDAARAVGRAENFENLMDLAKVLKRTDDLDALRNAAKILGNSDEFNSLAAAIKALEKAGDLDKLADARKILNNAGELGALASAIQAIEKSDKFENLVNAAKKIQHLTDIESLQSAARFIKSTNRIQELRLVEKVLKDSGLADDLSKAVGFARSHDALSVIFKNLPEWEDYINFIRNFSPGARRVSWKVWALEHVRKLKPYRLVPQIVGRAAVGYLVEEHQEIWEIKYYDDQQADLDGNIAQDLETYRKIIESDYSLNYLFSSQPSGAIIDQIKNAGGNVFWGPDNLPGN